MRPLWHSHVTAPYEVIKFCTSEYNILIDLHVRTMHKLTFEKWDPSSVARERLRRRRVTSVPIFCQQNQRVMVYFSQIKQAGFELFTGPVFTAD